MSNLALRVLVAAIYFPLILVSAYSSIFFTMVMYILVTIAWHEFICFKSPPENHRDWVRHILMVFLGGFPILSFLLYLPVGWTVCILGVSLQVAVIYLITQGYNFQDIVQKLSFTVMGFLYITGLFLSLTLLQRQYGGKEAIWFLFFVVGATDSAAYFAGRFLGSRSFFEWVSPSKTWEGFWGGVLGGLLVSIAFYYVFKSFNFSVPQLWICLLLGLLVSVSSAFGDLVESLVKRNFGVKDSGKLIPGHGGVLDRFDAVIFASLPLFLVVLIFEGFKEVSFG